jgi:subtilisin family serine protease
MQRALQPWLLCALLALTTGWVQPTAARDDEPREARETREQREVREQREEREERDRREDRDRERDRDRDREESDRSGSNSGSDRDEDRDDDERDDDDRSGSNSGSSSGGDSQRSGSNSGSNRGARFNVERDARGADRQRDEVLLIGSRESAEAVRRAGFTVISERRLESMRQSILRIRTRDRESVEQTVETLRGIAPGSRVAPNHIFQPSAAATLDAKPTPLRASNPLASGVGTQPAQIGVIDTGADPDHPRLRDRLQSWRGFAPGGYVPRAHGTAVAQLAASLQANVAVADVFGVDQQQRLVAPAELIAAAIDWLLGANVRVLNISIEGPRNEVLEFVVAEAVARGVIVVAAAGNGGPAAPPSFPAAYPGVVAVTALDEHGLIYRRATRGEFIQFAARGSYAPDQSLVDTNVMLSGTSFAAPVVAAEVARRWQQTPRAPREQILGALRTAATDLGTPGRDPIYGWGGIDPWNGQRAEH